MCCDAEEALITKLSALASSFYKKIEALNQAVLGATDFDDIKAEGTYYHDVIFLAMQELRSVADEMETLVGDKYWPFPTYTDLLYRV